MFDIFYWFLTEIAAVWNIWAKWFWPLFMLWVLYLLLRERRQERRDFQSANINIPTAKGAINGDTDQK